MDFPHRQKPDTKISATNTLTVHVTVQQHDTPSLDSQAGDDAYMYTHKSIIYIIHLRNGKSQTTGFPKTHTRKTYLLLTDNTVTECVI